MRNIVLVIALLTVVWSSLLIVTYIIAFTIFPALEQTGEPLILSILRLGVGLLVFALWVYGWYILTRTWLYRILLRG